MLQKCQGVYGDVEIIENSPSLLVYRDALYVPVGDPHSAAGLYDSGRKIIPAGSYHRGPDLTIFGSYATPYRFSEFVSNTGEETFIYCGHLHEHFGHFLLSSFSRYWPFVDSDFLEKGRILVHATGGVAEYLKDHHFAVDLFASIGLQPHNFVTFKELTRINNVIVIAPSFEETSFAHLSFPKLCNLAGERLSKNIVSSCDKRPVWLSKERLTAGVRKIVNENELTAILADRGVEIAYPEKMSLGEQARLWRDRPILASFASSALHASLLAPGRAIVCISDSSIIMSSFPLLDRVNGAKTIYLGVTDADMEDFEAKNLSFNSLKKINNPANYAESILSAFSELNLI